MADTVAGFEVVAVMSPGKMSVVHHYKWHSRASCLGSLSTWGLPGGLVAFEEHVPFWFPNPSTSCRIRWGPPWDILPTICDLCSRGAQLSGERITGVAKPESKLLICTTHGACQGPAKNHSSYSNVHPKYRKQIKLYIQPAYSAYATNNQNHWSNYTA